MPVVNWARFNPFHLNDYSRTSWQLQTLFKQKRGKKYLKKNIYRENTGLYM